MTLVLSSCETSYTSNYFYNKNRSNPSLSSDLEVCKYATNPYSHPENELYAYGNDVIWAAHNDQDLDWVHEALRRGLYCGVNTKNFNNQKISNLTNLELCNLFLNSIDKDNEFSNQYISEYEKPHQNSRVSSSNYNLLRDYIQTKYLEKLEQCRHAKIANYLPNADRGKEAIEKEKGNLEIVTDDEIILAASGSGFAVYKDGVFGYIVTNSHVIEKCQEVHVELNGKIYPAMVLSKNTTYDLAVLRTNHIPDVIMPVVDTNIFLAQDIYVAGYPFGKNVSNSVKVTKGIISSLSGIGNNNSQIQIDAAIQKGNSGGPIVDASGHVVGVAVSKLDLKYAMSNFGSIPENMNFGIKSNALVKHLLDDARIDFELTKAEDFGNKDLGEILTNGTYFVGCWMTNTQINRFKSEKVMFPYLQN